MTKARKHSEARRFLETLFAGKPDELYMLLWTLPEKESHWFTSVDDAVRVARSRSTSDLYVGACVSGQDFGGARRCPAEEVAGITGMWADLDLRSVAHPKPDLPTTIEEALSILPRELPPSVVVRTGNGAQAWWLFRELWIFESDIDRRAAATLAIRWQTLLRENASRRGWTYERLADLARVMRVPGTTNCKEVANRKPVLIHSQCDQRYNPSELEEYLDDLAVPDEASEGSAAHEWAERFKYKPLKINLSARIPDQTLERWMQADIRFRNTWFRQRPDLNDQSQSGYDLALACFGFRAGFKEQQIVDLMIHHRSLHKQKQRTRIEYFQRTLSKAASGEASPKPRDGSSLSLAPAPGGDSRGPELAHPAAMRAEICDQLSQILKVRIHRLTKISGDTPIFQMDLEQQKIEFSSVAKLIGHASVRNAVAAVAGKLIPKFKPKDWEQIAQMLLDACTVEDGGEEMAIEGRARLHIAQYLSATIFISTLEGQAQDTARKPMVCDGSVTACSSDIQLFLNKTNSVSYSIPMIVGMLSAVGAKNQRFRGKFPEQSRWILPADKFDPAEYTACSEEGLLDHRK